MNNRFGIKDLIITCLLVLICVFIWLAMNQFDRQWSVIKQIQTSVKDQTGTLQEISQKLSQGVKVKSAAALPNTNQQSDVDNQNKTSPKLSSASDGAFPRILAAQKIKGFARGGAAVFALGVNVGKLTPLTPTAVYAAEVQKFVLQSLAHRDPNTLKWRPLIAKSWDTSDNGLVITFQLRHNVTFSDGQPLSAKDVVFTYNLIMNPRIAAPRMRAYYDNLASVKAKGKYTVVFTLKKPYFQGFEICAGMNILPAHFYKQFSAKQFNSSTGLLMGSGPYELSVGVKGWHPGSGAIKLVRNPNYWGLKPALDKIIFRVISDPTARLTAFRNGDIDQFSPNPAQYKKLKDDKQLLKSNNLYQYTTPSAGYSYVGWNQQRSGKPTLFASRKVRQAMTMLINRKRLRQQVMQGLAIPITGPFSPGTPQYNSKIKPWPYDLAKAKKLLKEAGYYDRNGDGVIESPKGKPFEFNLVYASSSKTGKAIALFLEDSYKKAGIIMNPYPLEWTIMLQRIKQRDFDAMTLGWTGGVESDPYQIFDSKQIGSGGDNYTHYVNHKLDKLIETARRTMDEKKRMAMWHQVQKIIHIDQPYTFLFSPKSVVFVTKRMGNVKITRMGMNDPTEWFVPKKLQHWN